MVKESACGCNIVNPAAVVSSLSVFFGITVWLAVMPIFLVSAASECKCDASFVFSFFLTFQLFFSSFKIHHSVYICWLLGFFNFFFNFCYSIVVLQVLMKECMLGLWLIMHWELLEVILWRQLGLLNLVVLLLR